MDAYEVLARLGEHGTPPDADAALRMSVGLDETLERFRLETLPFVCGGGAEIRFCYGPYGRGKTHFLKSLQAQARMEGFVTAYIDCKAEQAPFASLVDTYRLIAQRASPPDDDGDEGIEAVIRSSLSRQQPTVSVLQSVKQEDRLDLGFRNLVIAYLQATAGEEYGLMEKLGSVLRASISHRLSISDMYRVHRDLPRPIGKLSARNASLWIRSLAALPLALNYPGFLILFDETEKSNHVAKFSIRKQQQHLANIRNLVDHVATGMFSGCVFCFAVVEEFKELAAQHLEALAQRIERIYSEEVNPRAVWTSLDELTNPSPEKPDFFRILGDKVVEIAREAGLNKSKVAKLRLELHNMADSSAQDISMGAVREFVKSAAAKAMQLINASRGACGHA